MNISVRVLLMAAIAVALLPAWAAAQSPGVRPLQIDEIEIDTDSDVGTAESSILKGAATLEAARGQRDLLQSQATINLQEAVDRYLDNQVEVVDAYNARRQAWRAARELERRDPLSEEGYAELAAERAPDRLTTERLDPQTGELLWPPILDAPQLKPYRVAIEKAFARRASSGSAWSVEDYRVVQSNLGVMEKAVRGIEERLDEKIFVGLLQLLESIEWEAQHNASDQRIDLLK